MRRCWGSSRRRTGSGGRHQQMGPARGRSTHRVESRRPAPARIRALLSGVPRLGSARRRPRRAPAQRRCVPSLRVCQAHRGPGLPASVGRAVEHTPPPLVRGRRIKLRYAHQGGSNPPVIVVHGNRTISSRPPIGATSRGASLCVRPDRDAAAHRVPHGRESVQGPAKHPDPPPAPAAGPSAAPCRAAPPVKPDGGSEGGRAIRSAREAR